jgi:phosphoserine phosphatase
MIKCFCLVLLFTISQLSYSANSTLSSWKNSKSRNQIISYVDSTTNKGSKDYINPVDRIAVFDNDGTLWAENPAYFQLDFAIHLLKERVKKDPSLGQKEPYLTVVSKSYEKILKSGEKILIGVILESRSNLTIEQYQDSVRQWINTAVHPTTGRSYKSFIYQPMVELLRYLEKNQFKTFIVSGGGVDFMRVFTNELYQIPSHRVVGSIFNKEIKWSGDKPSVKLGGMPAVVNDKDAKIIRISNHIGKIPVIAVGNSDGDLPMLKWTDSGKNKSLKVYIHHTDSKREWAYDKDSHVGRLDKGLTYARNKNWLIVDMKDEWTSVYPTKTAAFQD